MEFPIHRIQFYKYLPVPFTCVAASESGLLAAGRHDGSIEVYDGHRDFFMVARIPSTVTKSVEALSWVGSRLFYTGALGRLVEVDLNCSSIKDTLLLVGTPVSRCLSSSGSYLIIGNDEGFITVCTAESSPVSLVQTLPQLSGKILSLACHDAKKKIFAAGTSSGVLMVISFTDTSYHIEHTLLSESKDTVIWSLLFSKTSLFSGDSRGTVCVWDFTVGGLLHTFPSHYAHVLAFTASPDGQTVFSGGADALVRRYEHFVSEDNRSQWELGGTIRGCRRDIRGLVYLAGQAYDPGSQPANLDARFEPHRLLAVGLDARLQILACEQPERGLDALARAHRTLACQVGRAHDQKTKALAHVAALPFWPLACTAMRPSPCCFVSVETLTDQRLVQLCLLRYPDKLSLVRLARIDEKRKPTKNHHFLPMSEGILQLAELRPRKGMEIIASTLSNCGCFIAYSDMIRTRILRVTISSLTTKEKHQGTVHSVSISRVQWELNDRKRKATSRGRLSPSSRTNSFDSLADSSRLHGSSSETDTDTDDLSAASVAKFFALDQTTNTSTSVANNSSSLLPEGFPIPINHQSDATETVLPSASCLAFTADSQCLIQALRLSAELVCTDVRTGNEHWRREFTSETGATFRAHLLAASKSVAGTSEAVIAVGCSDGRVRLYSAATGHQMLTCACVASASGHLPLPTCLVFSEPRSDELNLSILYTNSQLSEWHLNFNKPNDAAGIPERDQSTFILNAKLNMWLSKFWNQMEKEVYTNLGIFHSLAYLDPENWLLASDRYLVLLTRDKPFFPGMVSKRLRAKDKVHPECCMRIARNYESIIQAAVVGNEELAVVALHSAKLALQLSAPMQRKPFGT